MPEHPAAVETDGLVKVFGVTPALVGVDLVLPPGAVCGLVGANGAGKTTLLRCPRSSAGTPVPRRRAVAGRTPRERHWRRSLAVKLEADEPIPQ